MLDRFAHLHRRLSAGLERVERTLCSSVQAVLLRYAEELESWIVWDENVRRFFKGHARRGLPSGSLRPVDPRGKPRWT